MGLRDKLRSIKKILKDPQGWTEAHGTRMNVEYARHSKVEVTELAREDASKKEAEKKEAEKKEAEKKE